MTRGRNGSLLLSRTRLPLATPHRPPGVPAAAAGSYGVSSPPRFEEGMSRLASSLDMTWVEWRQDPLVAARSRARARCRCVGRGFPVTGHGNRKRSSVTGSVTDRTATEHDDPQRQGQRQRQVQRQQAAPGPGTATGIRARTRSPDTGSATDRTATGHDDPQGQGQRQVQRQRQRNGGYRTGQSVQGMSDSPAMTSSRIRRVRPQTTRPSHR
jgi:hypothetical protein